MHQTTPRAMDDSIRELANRMKEAINKRLDEIVGEAISNIRLDGPWKRPHMVELCSTSDGARLMVDMNTPISMRKYTMQGTIPQHLPIARIGEIVQEFEAALRQHQQEHDDGPERESVTNR